MRQTTLETTQGQIDGLLSQRSSKCYLPEVASVGDWLNICPRAGWGSNPAGVAVAPPGCVEAFAVPVASVGAAPRACHRAVGPCCEVYGASVQGKSVSER